MKIGPRPLIRVSDGVLRSSAKAGLRRAGEFVLENGLPGLGAATGGMVGLTVGTVGSWAMGHLKVNRMAAGQLLLGVTALASPTAALVGLGLGAALAGVLEGSAHWKRPSFQLDRSVFSQRYRHQLQEDGVDLSGTRTLAEAVARAEQSHGAGFVLERAGQLVQSAYCPEEMKAGLDFHSMESRVVERQALGDLEVQRITDLRKRDGTDGYALFGTILVDASHDLRRPHPKSDFLLGHEASHSRHHDCAAALGEAAVLEAVGRAAPATQLLMAQQELSHQQELRADREGFLFAIQRGHSPQQVLQAATELFGHSGTSHEHPSAQKRIANLQAIVGGAAPAGFGGLKTGG